MHRFGKRAISILESSSIFRIMSCIYIPVPSFVLCQACLLSLSPHPLFFKAQVHPAAVLRLLVIFQVRMESKPVCPALLLFSVPPVRLPPPLPPKTLRYLPTYLNCLGASAHRPLGRVSQPLDDAKKQASAQARSDAKPWPHSLLAEKIHRYIRQPQRKPSPHTPPPLVSPSSLTAQMRGHLPRLHTPRSLRRLA